MGSCEEKEKGLEGGPNRSGHSRRINYDGGVDV